MGELSKDLEKFSDPKRKLRRPEYYIFATNVTLTPVWQVGTQDKAYEALRKAAVKLGLKDFRVWDYDYLCRMLDLHDGVRKCYAHLLTPGDVIAELHAFLGTMGGPPVHAQTLTSLASRPASSEPPATSAGEPEPDDAKDEIDRAGRYLERGKLDVAAELLDEVEKEFGPRLSARPLPRTGEPGTHRPTPG